MDIEHAVTLLAALLGPPENRPAYLDPGSGSILIQLLVAGLLGAGLLLRNSWGKVKALFGFKEENEEMPEEESNASEEDV